jgi:NADH-quinone oxidoreductase subunit D
METYLNMGPQHPSMHGVLHLKLTIDGENIKRVEPEIGFIHRGIEKLCENRMYFKITPILNKVDYIAAASWECLYVSTVEKLLNIEIPERAKYIRVFMLEMQRIMSHLFWLGTLSQDLGQPTSFVWAMRDRERFLDIFEEITGGRMTFGYMIFGGLKFDIEDATFERSAKLIDDVEKNLKEFIGMLSGSIFMGRMKGIGKITKKQALDYGLTGPNLRASGVQYDIRKQEPYLIYDRLDFDIPVREEGDCYARYEIRLEEIRQSIKMVRQVIRDMPKGPIQAANSITIRPPLALSLRTPEHGEAFCRQECPRGEGAIYLLSDGSNYPYRMRLRGPSFINLQLLPEICKDTCIADVVAIVATLDPVFGESDR